MLGTYCTTPGGLHSLTAHVKFINPLITHNRAQFQKSKSTENIVAFTSTLSSGFYVSWRCGRLEKLEVLFLVFRQTVHPLVPGIRKLTNLLLNLS
jgi:hypothetical protein